MKTAFDLLPDSSRMCADMAVQFLEERADHLSEFIEACDSGPGKLPMRASRVVAIFGKGHPELLKPYIPRLIGIAMSSQNESVVRNFLCFFEDILDHLSEEEKGQIMNLAFQKMEERSVSIVIRPISLRLLYRLSENYPELKTEVYSLAMQMTEEPHPSSQAVSAQIISRLRKEVF